MESPATSNSKNGNASPLQLIESRLPQIDPGQSELILVLLILATAFGALLAGKLDGGTFVALVGLLGTVYPGLRSWLKAQHLDAVATVLASQNGPHAAAFQAAAAALGQQASPVSAPAAAPTVAAPPIPNSQNAPVGQEAKLSAVSDATTQASAPPGSGADVGPQVKVDLSIITAILIPILALGNVIFFAGCGTPGGIALGNALASPANQAFAQAAIGLGVQMGMASLAASTGGNIPPQAETMLSAAATPAAQTLGWGLIYAGAQALRTKQGTALAASPGALTAAAVNQAGVPSKTAAPIANAIQTLAQNGVSANAANEAVAATLDGVASAKANPASITPISSGGFQPLFVSQSGRMPLLLCPPLIAAPAIQWRKLPAIRFHTRELDANDILHPGPDLEAFDVIQA